jgi:hypothetical protein
MPALCPAIPKSPNGGMLLSSVGHLFGIFLAWNHSHIPPVTMFAFGVAVIEGWPTKFPVPWFILALVIAFLYVIPVGMIEAITNQQVGLNVITELIIGYGLPGRPIAMMMFKTWGYITMAQALTFVSDFKLGHYMKIPPRPMFWSQVVATVIAGTVQLGVQSWMFSNIPNICDPSQKDGFICPQHRSVRYCQHHLGCHRPSASVLEGPDLLRSFVLSSSLEPSALFLPISSAVNSPTAGFATSSKSLCTTLSDSIQVLAL